MINIIWAESKRGVNSVEKIHLYDEFIYSSLGYCELSVVIKTDTHSHALSFVVSTYK